MNEPDRQLELFDVPTQLRLRRDPALPFPNFTVHADHLVLLVIVGLICTSVVFALGVERGKRLALSNASRSDLQAAFTGSPTPQPLEAKTKATVSSPPVNTAPPQTAPSPMKTPVPKKTLKAPVRVASESSSFDSPGSLRTTLSKGSRSETAARVEGSGSGFAIQVVSYRNPIFAQQELQRLRRQGEQAFLVRQTDRMLLCVGPFPSKARASEKLVGLKQRYQDCFVRSL